MTSNSTPLTRTSSSEELIEVTVPSQINPYIFPSSIYSSYVNTSPVHESYYLSSLEQSSSYFDPTYQTSTQSSPKKKDKQRQHPYLASNNKPKRHRKAPHELLTEEQKKANHIASEQKRRQNIKTGYDQLIDLVPTLNQGSKSEAIILQKSVDHIKQLIALKNELKNKVRHLQDTLGDTDLEEDSSGDEMLFF